MAKNGIPIVEYSRSKDALVIRGKSAKRKSARTVTRSFRIDEPAFKALEEEAEKRSVSVNTLLNQLIVRYANYDRFLQKLHGFSIPGDMIRDLLQTIPDEKLLEVAKIHGGYNECLTYTYKGEFALESFLEAMRTSLKYMPIEYSETIHGSRRIFTLNHQMGPKFALYLTNMLKTTFENLKVKPKIDVTGNTIVMEVEY